jgi:DNA repair protein SbcD/Mre11
VLAAHLHVRGAATHGLYRLTEHEDVIFDIGDLLPRWTYVALGHIHKPQILPGRGHVRYPGSLDRLDFGETHDDHGVLLLDVDRKGLAREPERLPLPATPFRTLALLDPERELPAWAENEREREAVVRIRVDPAACGPSRDEVARTLRRLFPRLYELSWTDAAIPHLPARFTPRLGFATTVRDYLTERLRDDAEREAVLALADAFLAEEGAG